MSPLVLLVEDDTFIYEAMATALEDQGFFVLWSECISEAEPVVRDEYLKLACLVVDVRLKHDGTGWDLARLARAFRPDLPVIYMTAANRQEWLVNGVPNSKLLQKPVPARELAAEVAEIVRRNAPAAVVKNELVQKMAIASLNAIRAASPEFVRSSM